jgi:hypothetical protein
MGIDSMDRQFRRVLVLATALAFGGMLGSLGVVGRDREGLHFSFHWAAPVLFVIGAALAVGFWRLIFRFDDGVSEGKSRRLWRAGAALLAIAFGCFLYPLRLVSPAKRLEVVLGMSSALVVLSAFGWLIFKTIRWVEEASRAEEESVDSDREGGRRE